MRTVFAPNPASLGFDRTETHATGSQRPRRFGGARGLAALMLAAVVSALVVLADRLISTWTDEHLFVGWIALWLVILLGTALFAAPARYLARRAQRSLQAWSQMRAEARAEEQLWEAAHHDPRLMAELRCARQRDLNVEPSDVQPWGRYSERLGNGHVYPLRLNS